MPRNKNRRTKNEDIQFLPKKQVYVQLDLPEDLVTVIGGYLGIDEKRSIGASPGSIPSEVLEDMDMQLQNMPQIRRRGHTCEVRLCYRPEFLTSVFYYTNEGSDYEDGQEEVVPFRPYYKIRCWWKTGFVEMTDHVDVNEELHLWRRPY